MDVSIAMVREETSEKPAALGRKYPTSPPIKCKRRTGIYSSKNNAVRCNWLIFIIGRVERWSTYLQGESCIDNGFGNLGDGTRN